MPDLTKLISLADLQRFFSNWPSWSKASTKPSYSYSEIQNTPSLGTAASKDVAASGDASSSQVVMGDDSRLTDSRTPTSHTHGNVTNAGALQTTDISIASGDKLVVTDSSDGGKVARTSAEFDGLTDTKCLTKKGTFEDFVPNSSLVGTESMIADAFDSTTAYSAGDIVTYEHGLYEFTSAHSAGAWNSTEVTEVNVVDKIGSGGGGGSGTVTAVKVGANGTTYYPDSTTGVVTTAEYSTNDHSHGSLGRDGSISNNVTIATDDRLIIQDYSDGNKIKTSSISFNTSSSYSSYALARNGTWKSFLTSHQSLSSCVKTAKSYTYNKTSGSLNDFSEGRMYCTSNCTNMPVSANMFVETLVDYYDTYKAQRAEVISGAYAGHVFTRYYDGSSWSSWIDISINTPIVLATSGNISSASIDLSGILTGTYLFTVTNNESGTNRYGCSLYVLQKFDSGTLYVMKPVSETTYAKLSSYSFSGNTMSLSFDKSGYKTLRLICLYR